MTSYLDRSQLPRLCVPALVDLAVGPVADHLDQVEDARGVLEGGQIDVVERGGVADAAGRASSGVIHHGEDGSDHSALMG